MRANTVESMKKASEMIRKSRYIDFYSCGPNIPAADYAANLFMHCGKITALYKDHYRQRCSADEEKPGHLAVIICADGLNGSMTDLAKCLKEHGTKILCFTKHAESPLGKFADHVLVMTDDPVNSVWWDEPEVLVMTSFKYLVDILFQAEYFERKQRQDKLNFRTSGRKYG